jgi:SAM-dependent methyltransferase
MQRAATQAVLDRLLPPPLADPYVVRLRSTGFMCTAQLHRLERACLDLAARLPEGQRCFLDVGCGNGLLGVYLADLIGAFSVAVDFLPPASRESACANDHAFVVADIASMPFRPSVFGLAIAIECLHLVPDVIGALLAVRACMQPGGFLLGAAYRLGASNVETRPAEWWRACLEYCRLEIQHWTNVTDEWRELMRSKHTSRWEHRRELARLLPGPIAAAECAVSRQMLGHGKQQGFINRNERWEFIARAR